MKSPLRATILLLLLLVACLPPAWAQPGGTLVKKILIRYVGPPPVSDDYLRANIRLKAGSRFSSSAAFTVAADEDVKNLYTTGFFYKIQITTDPDADGVDVIYTVQGKPILTMPVKIAGNSKMSLRKINKKITSKVNQPLDERKLHDDAMAIKELYEKAGYLKTTVTVQPPVIDELAGRATASILIQESPKVKIKDIVFLNVHAPFTQRQLRHVFQKTKRRWMFSWLTGSGVLKPDDWEDDKDALVEFYQSKGYIDFAIQDVKMDYIKPNWMIIRVTVSEGRQYKVGSLEIKGNKIYTTNDFIKGVQFDTLMRLKLVPGAIFKPSEFNDDRDTLVALYGAKGYLDPDNRGTTIITGIHSPNPATGTMDVSWNIQEGEKCYVEKIIIKGNTKTKDRVLRRELAVYPGEVYDMVRVKISKSRLEGLKYFSKVDASAQDTDVPNHKDLVVGVEEMSTGNFSIGAGFNSVQSLFGMVEVRQGNFDLFNPPTFTGAGQKLQLVASIGTAWQDYDLNFIEPWFLGKQLIFGVDLFHRQIYYDSLHNDYAKEFDGGTLSLAKKLAPFLKGTVSYTMEDVHVSITPGYQPYPTTNYYLSQPGTYFNPSVTGPLVTTNILAERGTYLVSKLGMSLDYDTRNNLEVATSGEETTLSFQAATPPGNTDFYKADLRTAWYFRGFTTNQVLELGARVGVASSYGNTPRVPIFERYFLGGLWSLRGYRYETVGPLDSLGEALGGDTSWFASAEYTIPIVPNFVSYALFYDIGDVYPNSFSLDPGPGRQAYNDDVGVGLRIKLPIGGGAPLRLDYGVPIVHDPTASKWGKFQFGFGYQHPF